MRYNWQQNDGPEFRYDLSEVEHLLFAFAERTGHASGLLKGLTADAQMETTIEMMVVEALKTSAIEGELLTAAKMSCRQSGTILVWKAALRQRTKGPTAPRHS